MNVMQIFESSLEESPNATENGFLGNQDSIKTIYAALKKILYVINM